MGTRPGTLPQPSLTFNNNNQPINLTYDASGNMTVGGVGSMAYDGENRMTGYNGSASYTYDGNGLRVIKSVSGGTTTVSIFSGSSLIAEYDNGAAPDSPSREYVYGGLGLLAMFSGGTTTYYHQDHLGVRLTTDANGNVLTQQGTFPFGESWYQSGSGSNFIFTSYERDPESGLDYASARYYDSTTGTFLMVDPVEGSPGDPQSWNRYIYTRDDPIDFTDPSGKHWWTWLLAGVAVAAAILAPEIDTLLAAAPGISPGAVTLANLASDVDAGAFEAGTAGEVLSGGLAEGDDAWDGSPTFTYNASAAGASAGTSDPMFSIDLYNNVPPGGSDVQSEFSNAPNNGLSPLAKCRAKAIAAGAAHAAIDGLGVIPGEGAIAAGFYGGAEAFKAVQFGSGLASTAYGIGNTSSLGVTSTSLGTAGIAIGLASKYGSLFKGAAELIPGVGQVVAGVSVVVDGISAYQDYQACSTGGG